MKHVQEKRYKKCTQKTQHIIDVKEKHTYEIGEMNYNKKSLNKNSSEKKI